MTDHPSFITVTSMSKELLSARQKGLLVTLGPRCEVFTLIEINKNCKWLHILSALVLLPNKFATNQRKTFWFSVFWILELWIRDCTYKYAYIIFTC